MIVIHIRGPLFSFPAIQTIWHSDYKPPTLKASQYLSESESYIIIYSIKIKNWTGCQMHVYI